jgi:hypothetical protein
MLATPATPAQARAIWADAAAIPEADLQAVLDDAWARCAPFIPAEQLAAAEAPVPVIPPQWTRATILDARDLWLSAQREGDLVFAESYALRVQPLSATVRSLLRPRTGLPGTG